MTEQAKLASVLEEARAKLEFFGDLNRMPESDLQRMTEAISEAARFFSRSLVGLEPRGCPTPGACSCPAEAAAGTSDAATEVWAVANKTSLLLFAAQEFAHAYVSSFPASVGGSMTITKMPIFSSTKLGAPE